MRDLLIDSPERNRRLLDLRRQVIEQCAPYHAYLMRCQLFGRPWMIVRDGQVIEHGTSYPPQIQQCMDRIRGIIAEIRAEYERRVDEL